MIKTGLFFHFFCGIGAILGGIAGMSSPQNIWGLSSDMLVNGPFASFFVPALFLFLVLGLGNLLAAVLVLRQPERAGLAFMAMGLIQVFFILIQLGVLWSVAFLHVLFLLIGLLQFALGLRLFLQARAQKVE